MSLLTLPLLLALAAPAASDTTLAVPEGSRLTADRFEGRLVIRAWERDEVRIEVDRGDRDAVRLRREGSRVVLRSGRRRTTAQVRVPVWMDVDLEGTRLDVDLVGLEADVRVRSVEGDVHVREIRGDVELRTGEGSITVDRVEGSVIARSLDETIRITRATGTVEVRSVGGDLDLQDVRARRVDASTVDGDVTFDGALQPNGEYRLSTHDGDVTVLLDADSDADLVVSTFDGDLTSDFPVTVQQFDGGQEIEFRIGGGGPSVVLQAFDGDIRILRR